MIALDGAVALLATECSTSLDAWAASAGVRAALRHLRRCRGATNESHLLPAGESRTFKACDDGIVATSDEDGETLL